MENNMGLSENVQKLEAILEKIKLQTNEPHSKELADAIAVVKKDSAKMTITLSSTARLLKKLHPEVKVSDIDDIL
jgi:hypothetical protein